MVQRPPDNEDPTIEEEAPQFDGTSTDQLDDTYRFRVVTASESASGTVDFDDRGQPHWKWITEMAPTAGDVTGTFDQLKALDNPALALADDEPEPEPRPKAKDGYDPYATAAVERAKPRR